MKPLVAFLFVAAALPSAVALDFGAGLGVKGGFPVTDIIVVATTVTGPTVNVSQGSNYIIGPVVELRLPFGFAFEADGLYRGTEVFLTPPGSYPPQISSSSWEIPYLAKFRFPIPLIKPFILAGGAYRHFNDLPSGVTPTHNAFVGGAGIELRLGRLRLSAEGRYLRWSAPPENAAIRLGRNQGEVLFGLIF